MRQPGPARYDWIEWDYRPLKDGLHDSGYRFIRCWGVRNGEQIPLHQWADHIVFEGTTNIDVTKTGRQRVAPWGYGGRRKWASYFGDDWYGSDAWFVAVEDG